MIRIWSTESPGTIKITVDGELIGESVSAVEASSHEAIGKGRTVHLFLRDVSHIDGDGRSLLARLAGDGVQLSASGVYSSYIVDEIVRGQLKF